VIPDVRPIRRRRRSAGRLRSRRTDLEQAAASRPRIRWNTCAARGARWRPGARPARHESAWHVLFDYGNNLRGEAANGGLARARRFPIRASCRSISGRCSAPARVRSAVAALSARGRRHRRHDAAGSRNSRTIAGCTAWIPLARERWPSRDCRRGSAGLGYGERAQSRPASTAWCARGASRPDRDRRDHLDAGSVASRGGRPRRCARQRRGWPTGRS